MLLSKKKTVREVLASFDNMITFDNMINDLDNIISDSTKEVEKSFQEIEALTSKIEALEREKSAAQLSRSKLIEIVRAEHEPEPEAVPASNSYREVGETHIGYPMKVEAA